MESTTFPQPVRPVSPPAGYQGGKRNLAGRTCAIIDRFEHDLYAEPCVGMGGIFFRRRQRPRCEIINDISRDVATLFRVLQEHYPYLMDMLRWRLHGRAEFQRLVRQDPETLTDLQRAARFLYLQKAGFGGKVQGRSYGATRTDRARFNVGRLEPVLAEIHDRLSGVQIECLDWLEFLDRYDRPRTLFYIDPPYFGCEDDYGDAFSRDDFARMAERFARLQGTVLLAINDTPEIRAIFAGFAFHEMETTWSIGTRSSGSGKRVGELLISNRAEIFDLPA